MSGVTNGMGDPGTHRPLSEQTCVITGANTGIGAVTARALAARGMRMVLACRSEERTRPVLDAIEAETGRRPDFVALDLGSLASVEAAAGQVLALETDIDVLINNAGLVGVRETTADGFEAMFGVNHLGHFLLTRRLMERLQRSHGARIVNVASRAHYRASGIHWSQLRRPCTRLGTMRAYSESKLCNVLFTLSLHQRLAQSGVCAVSLHPGVVATDLWRFLPKPVAKLAERFMMDAEAGAETTLHCATAPPSELQPGAYYHEGAPKTPSRTARDEALAEELWCRSEEWTGLPAWPT